MMTVQRPNAGTRTHQSHHAILGHCSKRTIDQGQGEAMAERTRPDSEGRRL